ncbi:MAG: hypothetical protein ACFE0O_13210 [Opitutales bacterium]
MNPEGTLPCRIGGYKPERVGGVGSQLSAHGAAFAHALGQAEKSNGDKAMLEIYG